MASPEDRSLADDAATLQALGYGQELRRRMSGFSNFAISLSIICILAGGITSFHVGFCSVGGAAIGLGWPLMLPASRWRVAATMGQVASAFPTAGGLYHWASILGGRGWGWVTAWFNLAGLVTVLAAINVGTYRFALRRARRPLDVELAARTRAITSSLAARRRAGRSPRRRRCSTTSASGSRRGSPTSAATGSCWSPSRSPRRCSGLRARARLSPAGHVRQLSAAPAGGDVWPRTGRTLAWLFALGLPAAGVHDHRLRRLGAHVRGDGGGAAAHVPRGIVRSVLVSGLFGWVMLSAVVLADPRPGRGGRARARTRSTGSWRRCCRRPARDRSCRRASCVAQYLCGLATVTSASRMAYAFARDGGLPLSSGTSARQPDAPHAGRGDLDVASLSVAFTSIRPSTRRSPRSA